jgi:hypothetical protein
MRLIAFITVLLFLAGCSYRWGFRERAVPGGYKQIAIPIFKNKTPEVGIEADFTNALVRRFERSQVASITSKNGAPVRLEGIIEKLDVQSGPGLRGGDPNTLLPTDAILTTEYHLFVRCKIKVLRQSDEKVLWEGVIAQQKNYQAPRIGEPVVNSANALYNESARRYTLGQLAEEMMSEAHDRITENF